MNITKLTFNEYMEYSQIYVAWLAEIKDNKIVNGLHIYDSKVKVVEEISSTTNEDDSRLQQSKRRFL